ncbi:hypothetical protein ABTQ23_15445, partial [Celerinatantimonas sp. MCCC 1A17872]
CFMVLSYIYECRKLHLNLSQFRGSGQQIRVLKENVKALHFWKSAVSQLCAGVYSHTFDIDIDLEMHFLRFEYNLLQHS